MWKLDGFPTTLAIVYVHMWEKYNYIGDEKDEFKEKSKIKQETKLQIEIKR